MTIPASQIVQVNPGVLAAAGAAVDLNGLLLTNSTYPPIGSVPGFSNAADVGTYFGPASLEASLSTIYFNGYDNSTKKPGLLYFAQYPVAPVSAYLRSGSLASMSLTTLKAITGSLNVTIDGVVKTAASINLSTATSFSSAAALLATALSVTVTYDAIKSAFIVASSTNGAASTITFATGTAAAPLFLTAANSAVTSQGAIAAVQTPFMEALIQSTQNWATFTTTWEPVTADKLLFSAWVNGKNDRFGYVGWDSDVNAKVPGNTTTWGYGLASTNSSASVPIFGDATIAMLALSYFACLDFTRLNGRTTAAFRSQSGLTPVVTNGSDATNLDANGYNFYGAYATAKDNFIFFNPGSVSGKWLWMDSFANQIWLNANLQKAMITLLLNVGSIPYNAAGNALIESACADPLNAALNFGAIRIGTTLSAAQVAAMQNAIGSDISSVIIAKGYYLQILAASPATRVARTSPPMTLYYADGGSVQQLTLASIEVQ